MVPGTAERDRFTSREQWNDWWRVIAPPDGRALHRVNTGAPGTWLATHLWQWRARRQAARAGWERVRRVRVREVFTGY